MNQIGTKKQKKNATGIKVDAVVGVMARLHVESAIVYQDDDKK